MHYELFLKVVFYAISRLELTVTWSENCMTQSGFGCLGNWPCSFHLGSRTNHWPLGKGWVICFIRKLFSKSHHWLRFPRLLWRVIIILSFKSSVQVCSQDIQPPDLFLHLFHYKVTRKETLATSNLSSFM